MVKRLEDESNQETRSSLLQQLIQELSHAEEKAAKLECRAILVIDSAPFEEC